MCPWTAGRDVAELASRSACWAGEVLGGPVGPEDDWHIMFVDGSAALGVFVALGMGVNVLRVRRFTSWSA
jgi:hypothetical protein